jgi:hypothetical protein
MIKRLILIFSRNPQVLGSFVSKTVEAWCHPACCRLPLQQLELNGCYTMHYNTTRVLTVGYMLSPGPEGWLLCVCRWLWVQRLPAQACGGGLWRPAQATPSHTS